MNLDETYIFIFVRQDLFSWQQLVHVGHASFLMGKEVPGMVPRRETLSGHPSLVIVGRPDREEMAKVVADLQARGIPFKEWSDPDSPEDGLVTISTEPLSKRDRNKLHHYRPWSERNNTHPKAGPDSSD